MKIQLTRRAAFAVLLITSLKNRSAFARELTARKFMSLAIDDINNNINPGDGVEKAFYQLPRVIPFVDWDFYYIDNALLWHPNAGQNFSPVRVPRGFVTDLASIPSGLWPIFPPTGRYAYAAIVHDYLYWFQTTSREDADKILVSAMEDAKVSKTTIDTFYKILRTVGSNAWNNNSKARERGEKRILSKLPTDPLVSWADWRKQPGVFEP